MMQSKLYGVRMLKTLRNFISDCNSALTLASITNTADNYGNRISEIKGQNYNSLSAYSSFNGISAAKVETTIIKSFLRVLPSKMDRLESEQKHLARMALNLEASQFAEAATEMISGRDREELNLLLYGKSEYLGEHSLSEYIYLEWGKLKSKDLDRLVEIRIDELSKVYGKDTGRSGILISMMRSCAIEVILLKLGAPLVPTLINALKDLRDNESLVRPVFSGFRTKI